jgi:hypothetical protein
MTAKAMDANKCSNGKKLISEHLELYYLVPKNSQGHYNILENQTTNFSNDKSGHQYFGSVKKERL